MKQLLSRNVKYDWDQLAQKYENVTVDGYIPITLPTPKLEDSQYFEVSIAFSRDEIYSNRQFNQPFTIQSISKFITLFYVLEYYGPEKVSHKMKLSASTVDYNTVSADLFLSDNLILNPFINAGALTIASMIKGDHHIEKVNAVIEFVRQYFQVDSAVDESVYSFEKRNSYTNYEIAGKLQLLGFLEDSIEGTLNTYLQLCALKMTTKDLAKIGFIFQEMVCNKHEAALVVHEAMVQCGLYRASPLSVNDKYIPAKSGVSGSIIAYSYCLDALHSDNIGLGIYSPLLNSDGNSAKGYNYLRDFFGNF